MAEVCGAIVGLEEQSKDVFVITAEPLPPHGPQDLSQALQSGAMSWHDLEIDDPLLRLRIAMLDKMRPLPRVELDIVERSAGDEMEEAEAGAAGAASKVDLDYFQSYEDIRTHELMLRDQPRMVAYRDAIMRNCDAIRGKTVLDVGCGTGILSMIAARAGAKAVYAVEASSMATHAENLCSHNGLSDIVTVIHARMEDVELPGKVDVIISEWMGFYLVHESMLNSVLIARDRWLNDGGLMLPTHATIYACPVSMDKYRKEKVDFWLDVCGLDLSPFGQTLAAEAAAPLVECIDGEQLLAQPAVVASFDCAKVTVGELTSISNHVSFSFSRAGDFAGVALWFDCFFDVRSAGSSSPASSRKRAHDALDTPAATPGSGDGCGGGSEVVLSTSPLSQNTHWMQTIVMLGVYAPVFVGHVVDVRVALEQDAENPRLYTISVNT